ALLYRGHDGGRRHARLARRPVAAWGVQHAHGRRTGSSRPGWKIHLQGQSDRHRVPLDAAKPMNRRALSLLSVLVLAGAAGNAGAIRGFQAPPTTGDVRALLEEGDRLFESAEFAAARAKYDEALRNAGNRKGDELTAAAAYALGRAQSRLGDYAAAV